MSVSEFNSIADAIQPVHAFTMTALTAGDVLTDAVAVAGVIIDRHDYRLALSAALVIDYIATLAAGKKLSLTDVTIEHGNKSDLTDTANFFEPDDVDLATAPDDDTLSASGTYVYRIDLTGAKRYLRVNFTPDLSNTADDLAGIAGVLIFSAQQTV